MVFTSGVLNRIGNKINQQFFTEAIANTIQSDTSQCGNYENCLSHFLTTSKQRFYTKVVSKYFLVAFPHFVHVHLAIRNPKIVKLMEKLVNTYTTQCGHCGNILSLTLISQKFRETNIFAR